MTLLPQHEYHVLSPQSAQISGITTHKSDRVLGHGYERDEVEVARPLPLSLFCTDSLALPPTPRSRSYFLAPLSPCRMAPISPSMKPTVIILAPSPSPSLSPSLPTPPFRGPCSISCRSAQAFADTPEQLVYNLNYCVHSHLLASEICMCARTSVATSSPLLVLLGIPPLLHSCALLRCV